MPYNIDPEGEAYTAFLFSQARELNDDERTDSQRMEAEGKLALTEAENHIKDCGAEEVNLARTWDEVTAELNPAMEAFETALFDGLREKIALGAACDDLALAARIQALKDRVTFQQEVLNLIDFVLTPQAHEATLKAHVKVWEFRHLVASLVAILHHDKQARLLAPVMELEGGHAAVFGAKSAELRAQAAEFLRRWRQSENELIAYQNAHAARQSARMAGGLTRAEIVAGAVARRNAITDSHNIEKE
jgi:uncharacterized coiled-coil protein SlyX